MAARARRASATTRSAIKDGFGEAKEAVKKTAEKVSEKVEEKTEPKQDAAKKTAPPPSTAQSKEST